MKHPLTKEAFAEWASKQPADRNYAYADHYSCAIAQYFDSIGLQYDWIGGAHFGHDNGTRLLPAGFDYCVFQKPHTFGALAERLLA